MTENYWGLHSKLSRRRGLKLGEQRRDAGLDEPQAAGCAGHPS